MSARKYRYVYRSAITGRFVSKAVAKRWPNRTVRQRIALIVAHVLLAVCAGCAHDAPRVLVRTETVEVPRYVRAPVDPSLTTPIVVDEPPALCTDPDLRVPVFCNGQLAAMRLDYRAAIGRCNADRAALAEAPP